jgi:hypothetical protein
MSHELHCIKERETDNAVLVTDDDGESIWFPLSQVESMHFGKNGVGSIVVTDWIAKQKGLS